MSNDGGITKRKKTNKAFLEPGYKPYMVSKVTRLRWENKSKNTTGEPQLNKNFIYECIPEKNSSCIIVCVCKLVINYIYAYMLLYIYVENIHTCFSYKNIYNYMNLYIIIYNYFLPGCT